MRTSVFHPRKLFVCLLLVCCALTVAGAARAEEEKPTASASVDFLNQYIWRGYALSDSDMVIQPSLTVGYMGFSLNVWGNLDTNDKNPVGPQHNANWNETDLTFSYSHEIVPNLTGTLGFIYYSLDQVDDSTEIYGSAAYTFPWFTTALTIYKEVSHYPGWLFQLDISRNFKLPWYDMSIDLAGTLYYQHSEDQGAYPDPDDPDDAYSAFHAAQILAALNIPVCKYFTISPRIGYTFPLSGEAKDEIKYISWDGHGDHLFGGIRLAASF